ncbi:UbiD family decarboxylase [Pyrobaculum neutrophilum]|uniref:Anhydromevalonate phosphate decarboxylase n=1 Tax=Pyrobaculum neutrophilum (strain DSM 2338 / JCM 9278 / NBRC 100436 / V24Sta) TaxID=444157 RepID=B1YD49_PYRNV|nr:UbiD family decarboxylase [Pyrobaculum neutrophilum]ACB39712.1 UbiD family decarboxylase [Pyrobaculum neutrophilum V24Sta]
MFSDLREFLSALEERGWLRRVSDPLSPELEIPEVLRRVMYGGGPAVLFESVRGFPGWRVAGNLFGSLDRVKLALGVERLEDVGRRLVEPFAAPPPLSLLDKFKAAAGLFELGRYAPRVVRGGPVREVVEEPNLLSIPAFKSWPGDAGRYITYGVLVTRDVRGVYNLGVYRIQILGEREAVVHAQIHKRAADLFGSTRGCVDAAIVVGGDPAFLLSGMMPTPYPLDEYLFAGVLRGGGLEVTKGVATDLHIPARAEAVVEGCVDVGDLRREGPFGDHYGVYDRGGLYPVFKAKALLRREDPIYYGTVVGRPPLEDAYMGKAVERVFLPVLQFLMPEVVDLNLPMYGLFQGVAIVSIRKRYPGQGKKVMFALWGLGHMLSLTKVVVVVDHDVDVHDLNEVVFAIAQRVDPQRDVVVVQGAHVDVLDTGSPVPGYGSKLGIDATRKLPEEYGGMPWPEEVAPDPGVAARVEEVVRRLLGR